MNRLLTLATQPVDGASFTAFRILFGLMGLAVVIRFFAHGWIEDLYLAPDYHFTYLGFGWVQPWPGWGMYAHFAALGALSLAIATGYRRRVCCALFFIGFTYVELIDRATYLNHYYWMSLVSLLLVFLPGGHSAAPRWTLWTLRFQVGVVYVFAGIAKLNPDWLLHALPLRIWLYQHSDLPLAGPFLPEVWAAYAMSWAGALFDLAVIPALLWRRTRPAAYLALAAFHLLTWILFPRLGIFPWLMMAGALIFFAPDWPRRLWPRVSHRLWARVSHRDCLSDRSAAAEAQHNSSPPAGIAATHNSPPPAGIAATHNSSPPAAAAATHNSPPPAGLPRSTPVAAVALALFVAVQLAMPLRHYAYPGNVRWNGDGYRFAWRVMLTEKVGFVQYRARNAETGQAWLVAPETYLTPLQVERMAIRPDLILQTAHIIAADFEQSGKGKVSVAADAFVSFNGRDNARLIDPNVDLAAVAPSLMPKWWVLPSPPESSW